ncbi:MAG: hypothetical protein QHH15_04160 [Candidatus Thermoplasmatota archaeon]|jgi:hypothetical protein|nr:hypothetical protein [Candidatus Thermoplasmatota archaeon]
MPDAKIVGFLSFKEAIFVVKSIRLTPQSYNKNYYKKIGFYNQEAFE